MFETESLCKSHRWGPSYLNQKPRQTFDSMSRTQKDSSYGQKGLNDLKKHINHIQVNGSCLAGT